ncbi:MAG TPA: AbrB/MazE/SpoVT family DNA-binding domain-containing protein [Thermoanaerobaculia bacterium]
MTVKGQVTVPKAFRDEFGWKAGDALAFVHQKDGVKIVKGKRRKRGAELVASLRGASWDPRLTTDELMKMTRGEPD